MNAPDSDAQSRPGGITRRKFFGQVASTVGRVVLGGGAVAGFVLLREAPDDVPGARGRLGLLRPPGSVDEEAFLARCIRCTRCSDACEAQCIRLFGPEAGAHQGTPYIVSDTRGCTMCLACGGACPAEAILPLMAMQDVRMGVAVVDKRLCVSHNGTGVCGACHTVCPLKNRAISQGMRNAPVVDPEQCTGCGLCEEACIVRDRRAIQVQSKRRFRHTA